MRRIILPALFAALLPVVGCTDIANQDVVDMEFGDATVFMQQPGVIEVPKVYVLGPDGDVLFEGDPGAEPHDEVVTALRETQPPAIARGAYVESLQRHGIRFKQGVASMLVSLEVGDTIGECEKCRIYYPELAKTLSTHHLDGRRWIRIRLQRRDVSRYLPANSAK